VDVHGFLTGAAPWWDHLLMEKDDAEKHIAELERQPAEARPTGDPGANQGLTTGGRLSAEQVRNVAFSKPTIGTRGYNEDDVDEFLDLVEAALRDPTQRTLTPEQVRSVAFSKPSIGTRGYNEDEVDEFLDVVEEQLKSEQAGAFLPPPHAGPTAANLARGVVRMRRNEESVAPEPSNHWELSPVPSFWKRRPPLVIDVGKDAIWVVDAKTNALVTSARLAQVTATRSEFTSVTSTGDPWIGWKIGRSQPLLVMSIPGLQPLIIGTSAMKGYGSRGHRYRLSWRGMAQKDRATYVLRDAEWLTLVEKFGLTPYLDDRTNTG
jgi:DivIVA domain-containing protein